jgi:hypothetical protein
MSRIIFLVEEVSMRAFLDGLMPRLYPSVSYLCIAHEGKQDLAKSLPRKLRAWNEPGVRFCVIRDNDGGDCRATKAALVGLCPDNRRSDCLVRIACQELEAWYLGDPGAVARAYGRPELTTLGQKAAYREPDTITRPSDAMKRLVDEFQKISGARAMGRELSRQNASPSYQAFLTGVDRLVDGLASFADSRA